MRRYGNRVWDRVFEEVVDVLEWRKEEEQGSSTMMSNPIVRKNIDKKSFH